ncbi:hypothetical protein EJB05_50682, partial [Eragrostis curvula]
MDHGLRLVLILEPTCSPPGACPQPVGLPIRGAKLGRYLSCLLIRCSSNCQANQRLLARSGSRFWSSFRVLLSNRISRKQQRRKNGRCREM